MKELIFKIDDALAEKFELAVQLAGDDRDAVAEGFVRQYLSRALRDAADSFREPADVPPPPPPPRAVPHGADRQAPPPPPVQARPDHTRPPRPPYWEQWGKAESRIPLWARKPQQNNHKILRAFFELQREFGRVTLDSLRERCSDPKGHPRTYVPHFDNNYTQMKFDNGHSHGKIFEEQNGIITIWDRIGDTIQKYRDYFQ